MFERFTRSARTAVEQATAFARQSGAAETRPEHLFAAVLADDEGGAVRALTDAGASVGKLRAELDRLRHRYVDGLDGDDADALRAIGIDLDQVVRRLGRSQPAPTHGRPRFSRQSRKVLELSLREAVSLRHTSIGTEHLLLALVRQGDRIVLDTLAACAVRPEDLRASVAGAARSG